MAHITIDTPEGAEFSWKPKEVTWERLWTFSGGPFAAKGWPKKNLHTDLEFAKSVGLPTVAASGTQFQGYAVQLMIHLFGKDWLSNGTMSVKFIKMVVEKDIITAKAKVQSREHREPATIKYMLDIWCENQKGDKVMVGTATGMVR
jgi:acyl dehydratase